MAKSPTSLRTLADQFGVSRETIRRMKEEGIDFSNPEQVQQRIAQNRLEERSSSFPLSVPSKNDKKGLAGSIERLQEAEIASHNDYLTALKEAPEESGKALKAWLVLAEQLRKISVDNPSVEKENSQVITKSELATELGELFRNLRQDLDSLPRRISLHSGKSKRDLEAAVTEEANRIIDSLFNCSYL